MVNSNLILASKSPRRQEILDIIGISYTVAPSGFNEKGYNGSEGSPQTMAEQLAILKGASVSVDNLGYVLSADTVVEVNGIVLGKPKDFEESVTMLKLLSGKSHNVITAVALTKDGQLIESFTNTTKVFFKSLSDLEMRWYANTKDPYDKAGGYGIQGPGGIFVEKIEGCYFNVVGLPLARTANLLRHHDLFKLEVN